MPDIKVSRWMLLTFFESYSWLLGSWIQVWCCGLFRLKLLETVLSLSWKLYTYLWRTLIFANALIWEAFEQVGLRGFLQVTEDGDLLQRRGRWANRKMMDIYVQEVQSLIYLKKISETARRRVFTLSSVFLQTLGQAEHLEHFSIPCNLWRFLFSKWKRQFVNGYCDGKISMSLVGTTFELNTWWFLTIILLEVWWAMTYLFRLDLNQLCTYGNKKWTKGALNRCPTIYDLCLCPLKTPSLC